MKSDNSHNHNIMWNKILFGSDTYETSYKKKPAITEVKF